MSDMSSNATIAKTRAIYGKRLTKHDYDELLHRSSVAEIADYLKRNTHYSEALADIDTATVHRGFLEALLKRDNFMQYERLCKFQNVKEFHFYSYMIVLKEIQLIGSSVMHINSNSTEQFIVSVPSYFINHSSYNMHELMKAKKFEDVLNVIQNTPYYDILKDEETDESGMVDCSRIDYLLRKYYVTWLSETIDKEFDKKTRENLHNIINIEYDLVNIINAYRIKAFSEENIEKIENLMLPLSGKLPRRKLRNLIETANAKEYIEQFKRTFYGQQITLEQPELDEKNMEMCIRHLMTRYAKMHLRSSGSAAESVYSILYLFNIEAENVTNIIEGIRYKAPVSYIEKLLIK